ncbi:hypothetical protein LJC04_02620 [Ruminococcaceae bacterium OttesenSCG-928-O06]|nr:hypothetical protein [Ruminococcaceae bacterium OttesenSCG-928-O06]
MKKNPKNLLYFYTLPRYMQNQILDSGMEFASEAELENYANGMTYMAQWLF